MNVIREIIALIIAGFVVFVFCIFALAVMLPVMPIVIVCGIVKAIAGALGKIVKREKVSRRWITEVMDKEKTKWKQTSE